MVVVHERLILKPLGVEDFGPTFSAGDEESLMLMSVLKSLP